MADRAAPMVCDVSHAPDFRPVLVRVILDSRRHRPEPSKLVHGFRLGCREAACRTDRPVDPAADPQQRAKGRRAAGVRLYRRPSGRPFQMAVLRSRLRRAGVVRPDLLWQCTHPAVAPTRARVGSGQSPDVSVDHGGRPRGGSVLSGTWPARKPPRQEDSEMGPAAVRRRLAVEPGAPGNPARPKSGSSGLCRSASGIAKVVRDPRLQPRH